MAERGTIESYEIGLLGLGDPLGMDGNEAVGDGETVRGVRALAATFVRLSAGYSFRKLKLADPVAMPIHLTHEYLPRSNNNHYQGTEIFVSNLLLDGRVRTLKGSVSDHALGSCGSIYSLA
jgi:hypothetical protein